MSFGSIALLVSFIFFLSMVILTIVKSKKGG